MGGPGVAALPLERVLERLLDLSTLPLANPVSRGRLCDRDRLRERDRAVRTLLAVPAEDAALCCERVELAREAGRDLEVDREAAREAGRERDPASGARLRTVA